MIEEFPALKKGEVAILRAEYATGHVVDEGLIVAINEGQKVYTVVENLATAIQVAKDIILSDGEIECVIYGAEKEVLYHLDKNKIGDQGRMSDV